MCDRNPVCRQREAIGQLRSDKEQLQAEVSALHLQLELSQAQVQQLQQQLKAAPSGDQHG
jgi:chaperonin cofactor prefoldin